MKKIKLPKVEIPKGLPLTEWFNGKVIQEVTKLTHIKPPTGRMFGARDKQHPI